MEVIAPLADADECVSEWLLIDNAERAYFVAEAAVTGPP